MAKIKYRVPSPGMTPVDPKDMRPTFKEGDIVKVREIDGRLLIGVITHVNRPREGIYMLPVDKNTEFFGKTGERLKAGEADYDYSHMHFNALPFTLNLITPYC